METEYEATIGLEVHAELKTQTKMFCNSKNDSDEGSPNVNICPVCLAHPGTLPVINGAAVRHVLRVGVALGSDLADYTEFDRKNYFYPDLPKGYQISQFEFPLVSKGTLNGVAITRIHLEEDTASSVHDDASGTTLVDYNRSGVPLMELVTEPVMHSAKEAGDFGRELQVLLRYLGASDANMEKGQMRVEANVSVARRGERSSAYVEIKNLNSFRAMERAVAYEIERQTKLLESGEKVLKQTLGWDENKQATFPQRTKEGSVDYRYFPDPDLPSLKLSELPEYSKESLAKDLPELPAARRERYVAWGIKPDDADAYVHDTVLGDFVDQVIVIDGTPATVLLASNYIANDLVKIIRDSSSRDTDLLDTIPISPQYFSKLIGMLASSKISSRAAKDILTAVVKEGKDPAVVAQEKNLFKVSSESDLVPVIREIIEKNPSVVADYKAGKSAAIQFLVGQGMRALKGAGDPNAIKEMIIKELS